MSPPSDQHRVPARPLPRRFYRRDPIAVARDLVGAFLIRDLDRTRLVGRIIEAEAYGASDSASHSFRGETPRNRSMFGPPGHAYVYISYGIHHCLNVVTDSPSAVLVRAIEPLEGLDEMARRRGTREPRLLCAGPGRLCQALGIDRSHDGLDLTAGNGLWLARGQPRAEVLATPRVGFTEERVLPWRFVEKGNRFASRRAG